MPVNAWDKPHPTRGLHLPTGSVYPPGCGSLSWVPRKQTAECYSRKGPGEAGGSRGAAQGWGWGKGEGLRQSPTGARRLPPHPRAPLEQKCCLRLVPTRGREPGFHNSSEVGWGPPPFLRDGRATGAAGGSQAGSGEPTYLQKDPPKMWAESQRLLRQLVAAHKSTHTTHGFHSGEHADNRRLGGITPSRPSSPPSSLGPPCLQHLCS